MIIGLLGKKGSGKDTIADHITKHYSYKKTSFAKPIKNVCKYLFGFNEQQVNGIDKEKIDPNWGVAPRTVLQYFGTDVFRNDINKIMPIGDEFWINRFRNKYYKNKINYVIADVRFQNEVDAIHKMDGIIIKVERAVTNHCIDLHESEKNIDFIDNYDYIIENNETVLDLYKKIDEIILNSKIINTEFKL